MTIRRAKISPEVALALAANGIEPDDNGAEEVQAAAAPITPPVASPPAPAPSQAPNSPPANPAPAVTPSTPNAPTTPTTPATPSTPSTPSAPASTPSDAGGGAGGGAEGANANAGELQVQLSAALLNLAVEQRVVADLRTERDNAVNLAADLRTSNAAATAQLAAANSTITACEGTIRMACERLCVALNANAADLASLHGTALVARFDTLNGELQKKFPTAGAARSKPVASSGNNTQPEEVISPIAAAAVAATRSR